MPLDNRIIDVTDFGPPEPFVVDPHDIDPVTGKPKVALDWLPVFNRALDAYHQRQADLVVIPPGTYCLSDTWVIDKPVAIRGAGRQRNPTSLQILRGRDGIRIIGGADESILENLQIGPFGGLSVWAPNQRSNVGNYTLVRPSGGFAGFAYLCSKSGDAAGAEPSWPTVEGKTVTDGTSEWKAVKITGMKLVNASATLKRILCTGFAGNGFGVTTEPGGLADCWQMERCMATSNEGWGFYIEDGNDNTQAGLATNCLSSSNGLNAIPTGANKRSEYGGGYWESSRLGNTYVGCMCASNGFEPNDGGGRGTGLGFYVPAAAVNNMSTFIGCYVEGSQMTEINGRSMWLGSKYGPKEVYGTGNILTDTRCNTLKFSNDENNDGTGNKAFLQIGHTGGQDLLSFGFSQDQPKLERFITLDYGGIKNGWTVLRYNADGGTVYPLAISLGNAEEGPGHLWIPEDLYLGHSLGNPHRASVFRSINASASPALNKVLAVTNDNQSPPAGYINGDFIHDTNPSESGMFGFLCMRGPLLRWAPIQPKSVRVFDTATLPGAAVQLDRTDYYCGFHGVQALTITLPANAFDGQELVLKNMDGNVTHTVTAAGTDTIEGKTMAAIGLKPRMIVGHGTMRLIRQGPGWWRI